MKTLEDKEHKLVPLSLSLSLSLSPVSFTASYIVFWGSNCVSRFVRVNVDFDHASHVVFSPDGT